MVMYHSITDVKDSWQFRHLSCPVNTFESHLRALRWAKYTAISLQHLYGYMANGQEIPSRSVVLTFDDGYLDNWVYAYPLIKKYRMHGTIFVNPDFVDPVESPRPNLEDVWKGHISSKDLPTSGFLSWREMREMEKSGCIDIQSHGMTHTWYFSSPEIIDYHHPGDSYPWLAWNAHPERKYMWMSEDQQNLIPLGTPVYRHEKSLETRRYFPNEVIDQVIADYLSSQGNETFFKRSNWREQLDRLVEPYREANGERGRFETDEEFRARVNYELSESKHLIEIQLNKKVDFLCWPGGGYNDISVEISKEIGYLASTISPQQRSVKNNRYGEEPSRWSRISPPNFRWTGTRVQYKGGFFLTCLLNSIRGSITYTIMYKALKLPIKLYQWMHGNSKV